MPHLVFNNQRYDLNAGETVLECLLRNNIEYPNSCKSGLCQSCIARASDSSSSVDPAWQKGLKSALAADGYFLTCQAKPEQDLTFNSPSSADIASPAKIDSLEKLNQNVFRLRLETDDYSLWTPGKYLNLVNPEGVIRSYSIANLPSIDHYIELHIKICPRGRMGTWVESHAGVGNEVEVRGPIGTCFYANPSKKPFPMILIGTGTGLAPLLGILRDALSKDHQGNITLIHGGVTQDDLYMDQDLNDLSSQTQSFTYLTSVLTEEGSPVLDRLLLEAIQNNHDANVYICGPDDITKQLKMKAFMAGIASSSIYSDAFLISNQS